MLISHETITGRQAGKPKEHQVDKEVVKTHNLKPMNEQTKI
jgi:hypothetical protein